MSEGPSKHKIPNIEIEDVIAYGGSSVVRKGRARDGTEYAVKIIEVSTAERHRAVKREGAIHKHLSHKHIVKLKEMHAVKPFVYFVFEYAEKRELFSYIEPGSGMPDELCHLYLRQLLSALRYIHMRGVCHRDIKPENILLDRHYNLLLTDFGSSSVYKDANGKRTLKTHCGSPNYMAPDVYFGDYDGEAVDVWSFGMVALVMMTGVAPWSKACIGDSSFAKYKTTSLRDFSPFNLLSREKLSLIESLLHVDPKKRAKLSEIEEFEWLGRKSLYAGPDGLVRSPEMVASKLLPSSQLAFSQPDMCVSPFGKESSSQPVFMSYDALPAATRIYAHLSVHTSLELLLSSLEEVLIQYKHVDNRVSFNTVDGGKNVISGEIFVRGAGNESVLIFQRTRGNCIEFKKMFNAVRDRFTEAAEVRYRGQ